MICFLIRVYLNIGDECFPAPSDSIISEKSSLWVSVKEKEVRVNSGHGMFAQEAPEGLVIIGDLSPHPQGLIKQSRNCSGYDRAGVLC